MLHLVLVPIPGDDGGMLPEELQKQCELKKIKGIYLMPSYANPTTISLSLERRMALAEVIARKHLILLEDDIATWLIASKGTGAPVHVRPAAWTERIYLWNEQEPLPRSANCLYDLCGLLQRADPVWSV